MLRGAKKPEACGRSRKQEHGKDDGAQGSDIAYAVCSVATNSLVSSHRAAAPAFVGLVEGGRHPVL